MNQEKIGKFIQERRKEKELTQVDLSEKLGVSNRSISKWETGKCLPDYSILPALCEELDITINELLSGEKLSIENYGKKLEENIISTIEYNNKKRNKKIIKGIILLISLSIIYLLYKIFITYFYFKDFSAEEKEYMFPNINKVDTINIKENYKANKIFTQGNGRINIYIPKEFELITDKARSSLVMDDCDYYAKDLEDNNSFSAGILICDYHRIHESSDEIVKNKFFPPLNAQRLLEKYNIDDNLDLIRFYEKNSNFKQNLFTNSDDIKINYIARQYVSLTLPGGNIKFYYLERDLKGYLIESKTERVHHQAVIQFDKGYYINKYDISFFNNKENYFTKDNVIEIISSIYR